MVEKAESVKSSKEEENSDAVKVLFFKSDTCAFCPRAEEVVRETIDTFEPEAFQIIVINVSENPAAAEEYGIFALPTVMIGGMSVTGIPEPDMILKMALGARIQKKKGEDDE